MHWPACRLLLLAAAAAAAALAQEHHAHTVYQVGTKVQLECKTTDGAWGPGPTCAETGRPLELAYGIDGGYKCTWSLDDQLYAFLKRQMDQKAGWNCQVPLSADEHAFKLPFTIPIWGVAEPMHLHVDNHINFVFHVDAGWIIGGTSYPMRERFQEAPPKGEINMHGEVRWFRQHTFDPLIPQQTIGRRFLQMDSIFFRAFLVTISAGIVVMTVFLAAYIWVLKPRLILKLEEQKRKAQAQADKAAAAPTPASPLSPTAPVTTPAAPLSSSVVQ